MNYNIIDGFLEVKKYLKSSAAIENLHFVSYSLDDLKRLIDVVNDLIAEEAGGIRKRERAMEKPRPIEV